MDRSLRKKPACLPWQALMIIKPYHAPKEMQENDVGLPTRTRQFFGGFFF
jgi:hypothetical protein